MIKRSLFLISLCVPILSGCNSSKHYQHAHHVYPANHHKISSVTHADHHVTVRRHEPLVTPYPGPLVSSDSPKLTHGHSHKHKHKHKHRKHGHGGSKKQQHTEAHHNTHQHHHSTAHHHNA